MLIFPVCVWIVTFALHPFIQTGNRSIHSPLCCENSHTLQPCAQRNAG
jgi:hypothetical protein